MNETDLYGATLDVAPGLFPHSSATNGAAVEASGMGPAYKGPGPAWAFVAFLGLLALIRLGIELGGEVDTP